MATTSAPAVVTSTAATPRVNLLPPEIEAARRFRRVQAGLGLTVVAAAGVVVGLYVSAVSSVDEAQGELDAATATHQTLQAEAARYAEVPAVLAEVDTVEAQVGQALGQEIRWSYLFNDLGVRIPLNVWLTQVTVTQDVDGTLVADPATAPAGALPGIGSVQFTGKALKHNDVAAWLDAIAEQRGYADPYFSTSAREQIGERDVVGFTSSVTVTEDALSRRYSEGQ